ncbi:hypothetical protein N8I74_01890 [Chitiniphilus purpureus]|uniref:Uncharacterized protein n=1 Tax=Chitiniphilus purpureus TaxID=2981137 RepID=A0ABY6DN44_9NEIS|nr:hypothetical protein [Chitiniphilus sp. CD1]UXY15792.1 hypothetical protein N8I74_01890 [Chitiniphilus sp. CD1]
MECIDGMVRRRSKREVESGTGSRGGRTQLEAELVPAVFHTVADRRHAREHAPVAERGQRRVVEHRGAGKIGHPERQMMQHGSA